MNNQQKGQRKATTIAEYLGHVKEIKDQWPYSVLAFRGQKNKCWSLASTAERRLKNNLNRFIEYHQDLIKKCKLKNYDKRGGELLGDLEILADLRHHGGAVCLIDFTRDALVALWFACENSDEDGSVFLVNTADEKTFLEIVHTYIEHPIEDILNVGTRDDKEEKLQEQKTFAASQDKPNFWYWTPAHLNERITAQHSLFVFGVPSSNKPSSKKIIIKSKNKDQMRQELKEIHDIHEESLFPDFVGFAYTHRTDAPDEILNAEEYVRRGLEAQRQGDYEQAIQYYDKAINQKPHFANAYNNRGVAYGSKGDFDHEIQDYTKAIELNPNYAKAYYNRGVAYKDKGDFDQAIQDFNEAIKLNPNYAYAYNNRGVAYGNKDDLDKAIQDFTKAIDLNPQLAGAYYNRGVIFGNKGDFERAIQNYTKAIELSPNYVEAYNNRGNAYSDKGELDQAIQDFNEAIKLNPNYAYAYNNRGDAYGNKGDFALATQDFTKAIALNPNDAIAYYNRGCIWLGLGEWEKARADLTSAKNMGMDIADLFSADHKSIEDFERRYNIRLSADIAEMLA